jgi:hypothetical protein
MGIWSSASLLVGPARPPVPLVVGYVWVGTAAWFQAQGGGPMTPMGNSSPQTLPCDDPRGVGNALLRDRPGTRAVGEALAPRCRAAVRPSFARFRWAGDAPENLVWREGLSREHVTCLNAASHGC